MSAVAVSLALVAVALVARDVALRVLADRARERGARRGDARALEELRLQGIGLVSASDATAAKLEELAAEVQRLKQRDALQKMGGR